ncbi:MAG: transcription antitermination factor NusB [Dysgonamonadaceae bacterium]|jgi:N utilization substance protein B|nr:transcription antitermination factor NusB [Dysgonamonadaceae bacterium]
MINRILIRIKVLQIFYAYSQRNDGNLQAAEKELLLSMNKAYDLYNYLLLIIVLLSNEGQRRVNKKYCKVQSVELNQNSRLYNNRFSEQLRNNEQLCNFAKQKGTFWADDSPHFIRNLLNKILESAIYVEYITKEDSYDTDKEFWCKTFKNLIIEDEDFIEMIENKSIYWIDDLDMIASFILKSIKHFTAESRPNDKLLPMFREDEDKEYAIKLLRYTILESEENRERITCLIENWDIERLAQIDLYIMQIAISEMLNFPSIPVNVTLNEYIDLSRYYSTPKSPRFINGTLDAVVKELQREGKLFKD